MDPILGGSEPTTDGETSSVEKLEYFGNWNVNLITELSGDANYQSCDFLESGEYAIRVEETSEHSVMDRLPFVERIRHSTIRLDRRDERGQHSKPE